MRQTEDRYISLLTDFGFKRIFGTKPNKDFSKLFEEAEIAKFSRTELKEYEDSLKAYRDVKNSIDTALERGREEGRAEGREEGLAEGREEGRAEGRAEGIEQRSVEIARKMLAAGMAVDVVVEMTGLPEETVRQLR